MKNKFIILFGILLATMSSCVYSLFPIYTDDTLVFRPGLLGKWQIGEGTDDYLQIEPFSEKSEYNISTNSQEEEKEPKYTLKVKEGFVMSSSEPIFILRNGEKIFDADTIRKVMLASISKNGDDAIPMEHLVEEKTLENMEKGFESIEKAAKKIDSKKFEGTITVHDEKSYKMTVHENDKEDQYIVHLVEIGEDLFLDLYPIVKFGGGTFSENYFPVHTFLKVKIFEDRLDFTFFDLEKLNKLFESNLIRMRHENVEGSVLITAQPKELQKFLDKYSDDESVFDTTESYVKVAL